MRPKVFENRNFQGVFSSSKPSIIVPFIVLFICQEAIANTEIINFLASEESDVHFPSTSVGSTWPVLNYRNNQGHWNVDPALLDTPLQQVCDSETAITPANLFSCPHELWVALDLDGESWLTYSKFTLRLSWPASSPADFLLEIYGPQAIFARLPKQLDQPTIADASITPPHLSRTGSTTTRLKYARIRAVDAGVLTPTPDLPPSAAQAVEPIPFILILEPLYLGILPASLLPTVCFLVPLLLAAALATPWIIGYLDHFVQQARQELHDRSTAQERKAQ
ncbi:hypothetical protein K503DRAFT_103161 [Rhizopogon vinicolor AM-OR11-026]|uniref:Uncharacterized protein n=1 Tax=Rhizopogon vinicolor AM-OR11-026 TaxID=1314800 RepID=A0A1B7N314_9AGAM|nr:hypothetical protein K503DRAFT_103161 [Rhizopogon vinicolor AM-OR11-026]